MSTETTTPTATKEEIQAIESKFTAQEADFVTAEKNIANLRAFFKKYRDTLAPFVWSTYPTSTEISFDCQYNNKDKQKEIARAFGPVGWVREKDNYTCGRINWKKALPDDGVTLLIQGAEFISKLIPEVKL